ncbi:hypothetical protein M433DRAFT_234689 [Acidomyces richmondensis BFW]|nr:MAG: hypothetical protein FE78DRAFT_379161 [Acidomyces sp. 'richmondensis']KYG45866.1 hypothetical protein M433DRAFT_234689 [Acidomyces richmondensis BFW]
MTKIMLKTSHIFSSLWLPLGGGLSTVDIEIMFFLDPNLSCPNIFAVFSTSQGRQLQVCPGIIPGAKCYQPSPVKFNICMHRL